jgi:hypothetical protein
MGASLFDGDDGFVRRFNGLLLVEGFVNGVGEPELEGVIDWGT